MPVVPAVQIMAILNFQQVKRIPVNEFLADTIPLRKGQKTNAFRQQTQRAGCYAFYDSEGNCLYVGKASRNLSARILAHLRYEDPFTQESDAILKQETQQIDVWLCDAPFVRELEYSLIQQLTPKYNIQGVKKR